MSLKLGSSTGGLGDIIILSAIAKYFVGKCTIQLAPEQIRFADLFKGLADTEIVPQDKIIPTIDYGDGHYVRRKLRGFFGHDAENLDIRPLCLYSDPDSEQFATDYLRDKPNPLIICPFVAKNWSAVRDLTFDIVQEILGGAKLNNQTPIFIQSNSTQEWKGHHVLNDLELRKLVCLLRKTGAVSTANTGVYHLAVAVGAKVDCYYPANNPLFDPSEWCYFSCPTIRHYTWTQHH